MLFVVDDPAKQDDELDDIIEAEWTELYPGIQKFAPLARLLLLLMIPFALQASGLIAENCAVALLGVSTLQAHIDNFALEVLGILSMRPIVKFITSSFASELHVC